MDVDRLRLDTAGTEHCIHLNNAGAALMPRPVVEAVVDHVQLEARIGGYEAADQRAEAIEGTYRSVESLLGAQEGTVALVENATAAFSQALSAIPFREDDLILTTRHDYVSNRLMYLSLRDRFGVRIDTVPDGKEGGVDVRRMIDAIHRRRPRLVAVTHVPTGSGLVQDVAPLAQECLRREVPFLLDACQSVGQMPVRVDEIPCTFLAATSRKFLRGPRGAGFLYVSESALEQGLSPLFPDLRGTDWIEEELSQPAPDASRFENWEFAWALILGLGAAVDYAVDLGLEAIRERVVLLAQRTRTAVGEVPGMRVLDRGNTLSGIVTVEAESIPARDLMTGLRERGINTSVVERGSALPDFDERGIEAALRISPHYYNLEEEVDAVAEGIRELVRLRRGGGPL